MTTTRAVGLSMQLSALDVALINTVISEAVRCSDKRNGSFKAAMDAMARAYPTDFDAGVTVSTMISIGGIVTDKSVRFYAPGQGQRAVIWNHHTNTWTLPSSRVVPVELVPRTVRDVLVLLEKCGLVT